MPRRKRLCVLGLAMGWAGPAGCADPARQPAPPERVALPPGPSFRIRTGYLPRALRESSGVAVSRRHEGILWSHNDSRNRNILFATTLSGELRGRYLVVNAANRDWEDIALAPCPDAPGDCLYIADTGDNGRRQPQVAIFVVPEPSPRPEDSGRIRETAPATKWVIRYENGPEDVEALAVAPGGEVLLVTKGRVGPVRLYAVDPRRIVSQGARSTRLVQEMDIVPYRLVGRWVTGAAMSPDGGRMVIRTYTELFFYRVDASGRWIRLGDTCFLGAEEPQGEGVDFLDGETLVLTSEAVPGRPGPVTVVRCPP